MRCSDVRDLLHPFLDGELEVEKNVSVLKHLELCPTCRERSESEGRLRDLVERATHEPLSDAEQRRLLQDALSHGSSRWRRSPRPRRWIGALAAAAALLLSAGAYVLHADPFCWWACPTYQALLGAQEVIHEDPVPLAQVEARIHRRIATPELVGSQVLGASFLTAAGMPAQPVVRYRLALGQVCFFSLPVAHAHVGEVRRLGDGREYLVLEREGLRFVGWLEDDGQTLAGCMPCEALPSEELYLAAAALRQSGST
jgi:hypothetical protein